MKVVETKIDGVVVLEPEPQSDNRGYFARVWDRDVLAGRGLDVQVAQSSVAFNAVAGTLRGIHFQAEPDGESKTIRCTRGAIWDVAVDLRADSPTRHQWVGVELSAVDGRSLYVPRGCAHGYVTLADETEVSYQISAPYRPEAARGLRWDDPSLAITWPVGVACISERDAAWPLLA